MIHVGRLLVFTALFAGGLAAFGCQSIVGIEDRTLDPCDETCDRCEAYCDLLDANCSGEFALYRSRAACIGTCKALPPGDPSEPMDNTLACRVRQAELALETMEPEEHCSAAGPGGGGLCGSDCESYCYLYEKVCPTDAFPYDECMQKCPALEDSPDFSVDQYYDSDSLECRLIHITNATTDPMHCGHAGFRSNLHCYPPQDQPPDCNDYCRVVMVACDGERKVYDDTDTCVAVCEALPQGINSDNTGNTAACRQYHSYNSLLDPSSHCAHAGPGGSGHCGEGDGVGNCESYCTLAKAACRSLYDSTFPRGDDDCQRDCLDRKGSRDDNNTTEVDEEEKYSVAIAENGLPDADPPLPPSQFEFQCRLLHVTRALKLGTNDATECQAALDTAAGSVCSAN
jgi:hypothetical protein